jgi:serine/threonine-protein kinase
MTSTELAAALADRYRVERELGQGGMATVYLAHDLRHDRPVAIKVLHPELAAALGSERFLSEIKTTAKLQHPHILPLLDSGEAGGLLFYVMPYISGETLRARLERETQLPIADAVRIAREVADALSTAHALGIVHRDIKPENILLQGGHALVADFGIALAVQTAGGQRMTQTGLSLGTPQYMSPEQAMGEKNVDARADVYALGAVTYEMLTGEPPFTGSTVQAIVAKLMTDPARPLTELRKSVPAHVEAAVLSALEKTPADRIGSAAEFARALDDTAFALASTGVRSRSSAPSGVPRPWLVAALAVNAIVLAAAAVAWGKPRSNRTAAPEVYDVALPDTAGMALGAAGARIIYGTPSTNISVSADGSLAVYPALQGDSTVLWYRNLLDASTGVIKGTAGASFARISPDGGRVAFVAPGQVMVIPLAGGVPRRLSNAGIPLALEWVSPTRLLLVHSDGYRMSWLDPEVGETEPERTIPRCAFGVWIPEERQLLCGFNGLVRMIDPVTGAEQGIRNRNPDGSPGSAIVGSTFRLVEGRYLVYLSLDGDLRAAPYDRKARLAGRSVTLLSGVRREAFGAAQYDVSATGTLVYAPGVNAEIGRLVRLRPGGTAEPLPIEPNAILRYDLSRDGRRLAVVLQLPQHQELRIYDLKDGQSFAWLKAEYIRHPLWSPDGRRIVAWMQNGSRSAIISGSPYTASAPDTLAAADAPASLPDPIDYHDEHTVLAQEWSAAVAFRFDPTARPVRIDTLIADAKFVNLSPDGRRLAYQTNDANRLIVTSFPPGADRLQVGAGGVESLWLSATELLYRSGVSWYAVRFDPVTGEIIGAPVLWGRDPRFSDTAGWSNRLSFDGGIIYVQGPEQITAKYLRVIPDWVTRMKAAVDSANR